MEITHEQRKYYPNFSSGGLHVCCSDTCYLSHHPSAYVYRWPDNFHADSKHRLESRWSRKLSRPWCLVFHKPMALSSSSTLVCILIGWFLALDTSSRRHMRVGDNTLEARQTTSQRKLINTPKLQAITEHI